MYFTVYEIIFLYLFLEKIYHSDWPPTQEGVLLLSAYLELFLGRFMSFLVFLGRSVFLQTTTFHTMFRFANLLKMNFMLGLITKLGKRYYRLGQL